MIIFESSKSLSSLFRSANLPKKFYEFFFLFILHTVRRHANDPIIDPIINPIGGTFLEKRVCPGFCFPPPAKKNGPFIRSSENTFSANQQKSTNRYAIVSSLESIKEGTISLSNFHSKPLSHLGPAELKHENENARFSSPPLFAPAFNSAIQFPLVTQSVSS